MRRRQFIQTGASAFAILPAGALAVSANGKFRTGHVGVGGMGFNDLRSFASHANCEVTALCDVDSKNLAKAAGLFPKAKQFRDYREMLATMGDSLDGVSVSTADHSHAPASMAGMNAGKAVYCQKPLAHEIYECRQLSLVSRQKKLATQMGIQIHSTREYRMATQLIQSGAIGKVSKVYVWSFKSNGYDGPKQMGSDPVPDGLDWNLWLGVAPERPYKKGLYHPYSWRNYHDFGTGTLGNMAPHLLDTPMRALALSHATSVKSDTRALNGNGAHPKKCIVDYTFKGTTYTADTVLMTWYDGKNAPPTGHADLTLGGDWKMPKQGSLFIGEDGKKMLLPHVGAPRLFPEAAFKDMKYPKLSPLDHYHQWIDAGLGKGTCSADFTYSAGVTEVVLLGVVANRFPQTKLLWDGPALRFTNEDAANALVRRQYRKGFEIENL